jgi:uncharacterized membrane protein
MSSSPYTLLLSIHDDLRWLVLLSALVAVIAALTGLLGGRPFRPLGRVTGVVFISVMDLQFLLGLILCFLSPWVARFWSSPGAAMKVKEARFFGMEHLVIMIAALALAHVGAARSKRAGDDAKAYRTALVWFSVSLVLILAGIPWWRPLFQI